MFFDRKELIQMANFILGGFALVVLFEMAVQYFPPQAVQGATYYFVNASEIPMIKADDRSFFSNWLYAYRPGGQTTYHLDGKVEILIDEHMPAMEQNLVLRHENCHARQHLSGRAATMTDDQKEAECYAVMWLP
jgi:hypothetical protein